VLAIGHHLVLDIGHHLVLAIEYHLVLAIGHGCEYSFSVPRPASALTNRESDSIFKKTFAPRIAWCGTKRLERMSCTAAGYQDQSFLQTFPLSPINYFHKESAVSFPRIFSRFLLLLS
jgi:hypothetical protein